MRTRRRQATRKTLLGVLCVLSSLSIESVLALDTVIDLDPTWTIDPIRTPSALCGDRLIVVARRFPAAGETNPLGVTHSRLNIIAGKQMSHTIDVAGKVTFIRCNPENGAVILGRRTQARPSAQTTIEFFDDAGELVWSKIRNRSHRLAFDGTVGFSLPRGSRKGFEGAVGVVDLTTGLETSTIEVDGYVKDWEVFDSGHRAVALIGHSVVGFSLDQESIAVSWRIDLVESNDRVRALYHLRGSQFVVDRNGAFAVVDVMTGSLVYEYDPYDFVLGLDPPVPWSEYAVSTVRDGTNGKIRAFDYKGATREIDMTVGIVSPVSIVPALIWNPVSSIRAKPIHGDRFVIIEPTRLTIREVSGQR